MILDIIIVYYKTLSLLKRCLNSVHNLDANIIIVDNNSLDDAKEIISKEYPNINWITNVWNEGFGRANNIGIRSSSSDYILLLNSDMVIPQGVIDECLGVIKMKKDIGVLGCKLINEDGSHQKSVFSVARFRELLDQNLIYNYLLPLKVHRLDAVMGSFMLIPRKVLNDVGLFDPDFFMYAEELELCHRIKHKGYSIIYYDEATAIHKHGGSVSNSDWGAKQKVLSTALLYYKVRGLSGYIIYHFIVIFNFFTNFFAMWLLDKQYRKGFWIQQKYYFSNWWYYLTIPFLYSTKIGNGKRMLKRS